MQLLLDLPEVTPALAGAVITHPKKLKEWLISLPTSNVVEAGRLMHDALASLNRIELGPDDRAKLLAEYETMLELLGGGFESACASPGVPPKDRSRQAATLYRNLWQEMTMGWKVALVSRLEKRSFFSSGKADPYFVQRVLNGYWQLFRAGCRLYLPMPSGAWSEIHQMFRLGAENEFLDEPSEPKNRSIATTYKRILLLSLADVLRFAPEEQDKVIEIVENYAHLAHFLPLAKQPVAAGHFLIELDSDKPPHFIGGQELDNSASQAILLETEELSTHLHRAEAIIESKAPQANDRAKVLARLQILRRANRQWTIAPQRTYQRIASHAMVDVIFGLRALVAQLNDGELPPEPAETEADDQPASRPIRIAMSKWQVLNESPGGFALRSVSIDCEQVRAGDLVGLRAQHNAPWMVASVRWLQQNAEGGVEMGLQVMAARAIPALIRPTIGAGPQLWLPAILLPEIPALKQVARIAASKGTYTPLRELAIATEEGEYKVRAAKLIEQQMNYDLFDYQSAQPLPNARIAAAEDLDKNSI